MTLHEAIEQVIREIKRPMKAVEIANIINTRGLYKKGDHSLVTQSQISARINKYPDLFKTDEQGISLHDISIRPYREFSEKFQDLIFRISPGVSDSSPNLIAPFLILIYYTEGGMEINPAEIKSNKDLLINAFGKIKHDVLYLDELFIPTTNFISNSLSEFGAEQIVKLIRNYRFSEMTKPSQEEFSVFFSDVISGYGRKNDFTRGQFYTPKSISTLISTIYELPKDAKVFDPFAGIGGMITELIRNQKINISKIIAWDNVQDAVILGSLNIYASGFRSFSYDHRNAFEGQQNSINADFIISNPPFGARLDNITPSQEWQIISSRDVSVNAIQLSLYNLNSEGKAILVLPESILFNSSIDFQDLRKYLANNELIQGIIQLPRSIFKPYAGVNAVVLIIDKTRQSKIKGTFLYDASDVPVNEFQNEIKNILSAFYGESIIIDKVRWISNDEIRNNNYQLSVKRYLLQSFEQEEYVKLSELLEIQFTGKHISSKYINKSEGIPFIQIGDLSDGQGLDTLQMGTLKSYISDIELVSNSIRTIPKGSVLVAKVGNKLKPTLYDDDLRSVASSNIIVLKPKADVLAEYLVSQLQSEYVQKQLDAIRRYNGIPNYNLRDFLNIRIKKLPKEQQQQYVASYYSRKISDVEKSEIINKENEFFNLISKIKHEIKQPVSSIGIDISVLEDYLKDKETKLETVSLNDFAVEGLPGQLSDDLQFTKIVNIINRIKECVKDAQETLKNAEETLNIGIGTLKLEQVEIKNYIESVIKPLYVNANCVIVVKGKELSIMADKYQLKVLFSHLINNALKHGFTSSRPKNQNIIEIVLEKQVQRNYFEIIVMNNGEPFSRGFNKALFETKGVTSNRENGSGFGGYHIKRIIENHRGEFQIADEEEVRLTEFKVKFKIYLPLNN